MAKHWPIVFPGYELTSFLNTEVICQRIVVMPTNKLCLDDFRDVREAPVVQDAVNVVSALLAELLIGLLVGPQFPGLLVLGVQFV